jgi:hypothetical protein
MGGGKSVSIGWGTTSRSDLIVGPAPYLLGRHARYRCAVNLDQLIVGVYQACEKAGGEHFAW